MRAWKRWEATRARGLGVVGVVVEAGVGGALDLAGRELATPLDEVAGLAAYLGVFVHDFGHDVAGTGQGGVGVGHLGADELARFAHRIAGAGLGQDAQGQGLEAALAGHGGAGAALGLVGQVEVFQVGQGGAGFDLGLERRGQLALSLDGGEHGGAAGFELLKSLIFFLNLADLHLIEAARALFAVAGDEGHGGPLGEQGGDSGHPGGGQAKGLGDAVGQCGHGRRLPRGDRKRTVTTW
jgi:hypothetical protein